MCDLSYIEEKVKVQLIGYEKRIGIAGEQSRAKLAVIRPVLNVGSKWFYEDPIPPGKNISNTK